MKHRTQQPIILVKILVKIKHLLLSLSLPIPHPCFVITVLKHVKRKGPFPVNFAFYSVLLGSSSSHN